MFMKTIFISCKSLALLRTVIVSLCMAFLVLLHSLSFNYSLQAYPPVPDHLFFGVVRDEMGNPLSDTTIEIILETSSGTRITTNLKPGSAPGMNYCIIVPMDLGITDELYKATALRPTVPFTMKVKMGKTTYLPIEMKADFRKLGQPGQRTRMDLTLGEDANGNGLPDAWERAYLAQYGGKDLKPGDHANGNNLSVMEQYIAGTYELKDPDGFNLKILRWQGSAAQLEFLAISGRTYSIQGSVDLQEWKPVSFRFSSDTVEGAAGNYYYAADTRLVKVDALTPDASTPMKFFKLMVQ